MGNTKQLPEQSGGPEFRLSDALRQRVEISRYSRLQQMVMANYGPFGWADVNY